MQCSSYFSPVLLVLQRRHHIGLFFIAFRQQNQHAERLISVRQLDHLHGFIFGVIEFCGLTHHVYRLFCTVFGCERFLRCVFCIKFCCPASFEVNRIQQVHQVIGIGFINDLFNQVIGIVRCPLVNDIFRYRK